jgi:hypothetical protein
MLFIVRRTGGVSLRHQGAVELVSETSFHGSNRLLVLESSWQNGFPTPF